MKLLLPKTYLPPVAVGSPIFFLAGPCSGGGDWQQSAIRHLWSLLPDAIAVNPRWCEKDHPLLQYRIPGREDIFPRAIAWEREYMQQAALPVKRKQGCIMFWLPCESKTAPRTDGNPHARDTYGELGEWRMRIEFEGARVVVEAEAGFPGLSQIKYSFDDVLGMDFPIYPTLEATVEAGIAMAKAGRFPK